MRRKTYIELLIEQIENLRKDTRKMDYESKLKVILAMYDQALDMLSSRMTPSQMAADITAQECGIVSMFFRQYLSGATHVYKIARNFGQHLNKTKLDVPTKLMPVKVGKTYMLEFPENIVFFGPDGEVYHNCIVAFGFYEDKAMSKQEFKMVDPSEVPPNVGFTLQICAPDVGGKEMVASISVMDIASQDSIQKSIDLFVERYGKMHFPHEMVSYIAKCILYIESGEPDLHPEGRMAETRNHKKQRALQHKDLYPFPIIRVGYGFHNREYHVDSALVSGHFRWQPYGPQLSQVKLIWIDEHTRNYRK